MLHWGHGKDKFQTTSVMMGHLSLRMKSSLGQDWKTSTPEEKASALLMRLVLD